MASDLKHRITECGRWAGMVIHPDLAGGQGVVEAGATSLGGPIYALRLSGFAAARQQQYIQLAARGIS